jgi:C1A family cysteine protease
LFTSARPIVLLVRRSIHSSFVANLFSGAYEYLTKKSDGRNTDVSRLFIYYNSRAKENQSRVLTDSGCTMTSAIEALEEFGTCLESIWPYNISEVNSRPSDRAYQEARNHKITEALQIEIDLYEMKSCLAQGFPFAFGLQLFKSFDKASKTGVVPMPNASERIRSSHGRSHHFFIQHENRLFCSSSHALLAVGYSDHSKSFIVRNSWGENWVRNVISIFFSDF